MKIVKRKLNLLLSGLTQVSQVTSGNAHYCITSTTEKYSICQHTREKGMQFGISLLGNKPKSSGSPLPNLNSIKTIQKKIKIVAAGIKLEGILTILPGPTFEIYNIC